VLPFGKGRQFLRNNAALDYVVADGKRTSPASSVRFPAGRNATNANSVIGASYQLSQRNRRFTSDEWIDGLPSWWCNGATGWLNPLAFSQAPVLTFGDISRFLNVRGPGCILGCLALQDLSVKEKVKAQFRAEALNLTNTPQFGKSQHIDQQLDLRTDHQPDQSPAIVQLGVRITF